MITPDDVLDWLEEQKIIHNDYIGNTILKNYKPTEDGYIRLLKWLEENDAATPENCRVSDCWMLVEAVRRGDMWVLEWLRKHGAATVDDCRAQRCEAFYSALFSSRLPVLEWLHAQGAVTPADYSYSARMPYSFKGISMLGWLEKQGAINVSSVKLNAKDIPALEWLKARGAVCCTDCLLAAARSGCLHVLKWLKDHGLLEEELNNHKSCFDALRYAAENGHTHVLQWLEEQGAATPENCREWECCILLTAAEKGDMTVLNWLDKVGAATPTDCQARNSGALWRAILGGHVEVAEWLLARGATMSADWQRVELIPRVAYNNHLDMLKWLTEKKYVLPDYCDGHHWSVLRNAAHNGNTDILNWLNEIKPITQADYRKQTPLQSAATECRIPVIQWFYERGFLTRDNQEDETIIVNSVYSAVRNGRTEVVEWLYKHGVMTPKDCKNMSVIYAAHGGHLPVLKWLHSHQMLVPADFDNPEMRSLAFYGQLEILDWLAKERLFVPKSGAGVLLFSDSNLYKRKRILRWFAEHVDLHWFEVYRIPKIWWDVWYKKQLFLILAGKRRKLRLPAELWELLNSYCT